MSRGLLLFARGRPLGEQGLDWLYVHLANVWGNGQDKLSFEGRRWDWSWCGIEGLRGKGGALKAEGYAWCSACTATASPPLPLLYKGRGVRGSTPEGQGQGLEGTGLPKPTKACSSACTATVSPPPPFAPFTKTQQNCVLCRKMLLNWVRAKPCRPFRNQTRLMIHTPSAGRLRGSSW